MSDWTEYRRPRGKEDGDSYFGVQRKKMEEIGVHFVAGQQLEARLKLIDSLCEVLHRPLDGKTPLQNMAKLRAIIEEFDTVLKKQSWAWLRAGNEERFRRAIHGYGRLLKNVLRDWIAITAEMESRNPIDQLKMEKEFEIWPCQFYFEKGSFLGAMSFSDTDITPTQDRTIVLHTPPNYNMPFGPGTTAPTSGGRTSEDQASLPSAHYPPEMSNSIEPAKEKPKPKQSGK